MKYYIIAGEASGDLHGSNLMRGLYAKDTQAEIRFWGGDLMDSVYRDRINRNSGTGCTVQLSDKGGEHSPFGGLVHHYREGAVMGVWEVLRKGGRLLKNVKECKEDILAHRPDVVSRICAQARTEGFLLYRPQGVGIPGGQDTETESFR